MIDRQELEELLKQDPDFLELYQALRNMKYTKTFVFLSSDNRDIAISGNLDMDIKNILDFVLDRHVTNNTNTMLKIIKHFLFSMYVATNVWDMTKASKILYNGVPVKFDAGYWRPTHADFAMSIGGDNFVGVNLCVGIEPAVWGNEHVIIRFITDTDLVEKDNLYLKAVKICFQIVNNTIAETYLVDTLTKKEIEDGIKKVFD